MIEAPLTGWLALALVMVLSSVLGVALARRVPFAPFAGRSTIISVGIAMGPLLLGIVSTAVIAALPRWSHVWHYGVIAITLALLAVVLTPAAGFREFTGAPAPAGSTDRGLQLALALFGAVLLLNALTIPLVQSDALEYATAARRLFEVRSLAAYPPLDPVGDPSGFYGPWTHPPLYTALIYLAYVCQGHADWPGLMRLLSPWALASSALLVAVVGATRGRRLGLLAALFLLATPSLFLGADSAQIDAFTVLGMCLVIAALAMADTGRVSGLVTLGGFVGAAMWTHSQAVLVLPLTLVALLILEWRRGRISLVKAAGVVTAVALLVGAWPYVANYVRLGVIISDNPAVYAIESLDWAGYFRSERNLAGAFQRLAYGILKGWTTLDAFALGFWFMTFGAVIVLRRRNSDAMARFQVVALALAGCYLAGVMLSAAAGIDLMIRNERYQLLIMPCVALLAASGVDALWPRHDAQARQRARLVFAVGVLAMFAIQPLALHVYRLRREGLSPADLPRPMQAKLGRWSSWPALAWIRSGTADASNPAVLALKPSEMYYTGRRMVSYLDPRLVAAYLDTNPSSFASRLRDLGIGHVHVPPYAAPPLYNSALGDVLADPALSALEISAAGNQVYRLLGPDHMGASFCEDTPVGPDVARWNFESGYVLGGAKQFARFGVQSGALAALQSAAPVAMFPRERSTVLRSPLLPVVSVSQAHRERRITLRMTGFGFAHVVVEQYDDAVLIAWESLGGTLLRGDTVSYARRFLLAAESNAIRVRVEHGGRASVAILEGGATLSRPCPVVAP